MTVVKALTIAGSDSGGGAGIQADVKTFQELGSFGMSVVTAVTAQNTIGVHGVYPIPEEGIVEQIDAIGKDLPPNATKTGMLFSSNIIKAVSGRIREYNLSNIVVDPVMVAKGGAKLLQDDAVKSLKESLLPLATVVTPNIPEAEILTGLTINTVADQKEAAKRIVSMGAKSVVVKGGHGVGAKIIDLFYDGDQFVEHPSKRIETPHTHGTGCTFSAAITAELAQGKSMKEAVQVGKLFIQRGIEQTLGIGQGHGPTNHWAYKQSL
ncbi:bifunctional hydroxymethylpyrimidine kinase/phosphomethylpyrimidine kinase [Salirhabdus salicampi]|uniref:bifunctional hydroxymethylpyrimidine kinase/phosphomethylpyrimidine kinase n=1 Tax=Salirhabdus salicampi TaxID=476102 RepID=UPI0020C395D4|nr:bifunctional hydroxymethylpyrimidine kinase/phosphomethylpyrimidine kinase [Salirhabdus salicampi]MCP8615854.1 bifunctional hydroxymethylpyrimidine kinase/phosphomethylpyrimidine kinase [Salirhabdus salicampi]